MGQKGRLELSPTRSPMTERHFRGLERAYAAAPVTKKWMGTTAEVRDGHATVSLPIRGDFHHAASAVHGSLYFRMLEFLIVRAGAAVSEFETYLHEHRQELRAEGLNGRSTRPH